MQLFTKVPGHWKYLHIQNDIRDVLSPNAFAPAGFHVSFGKQRLCHMYPYKARDTPITALSLSIEVGVHFIYSPKLRAGPIYFCMIILT